MVARSDVCILVLVLVAATGKLAEGLPISSRTHRPLTTMEETSSGSGRGLVTSHHRVRRQNGEVVESIFQIPIQTLMAVSKVFTTGIQSFNRQREQFYQATSSAGSLGNRPVSSAASAALYNRPYSSGGSGSYSSALASAYTSLSSRPRSGAGGAGSKAASVAGVGVQADGSSYRI